VAATQDAVLKIETLTGATPTNLWDYLYGPRVMPGVGSGFFFEYEDRLLVLTNAHVVADAQEIMLELARPAPTSPSSSPSICRARSSRSHSATATQ